MHACMYAYISFLLMDDDFALCFVFRKQSSVHIYVLCTGTKQILYHARAAYTDRKRSNERMDTASMQQTNNRGEENAGQIPHFAHNIHA